MDNKRDDELLLNDKIRELEERINKLNNNKNVILNNISGFRLNIVFPLLLSLVMAIVIDFILIVNGYFSSNFVSLVSTSFGVVNVYNLLVGVISFVCICFGSLLSISNYLDYKKSLNDIKEIDGFIFQLSKKLMCEKNKLEFFRKSKKTKEIKKNHDLNLDKMKYFNENLGNTYISRNKRRILVKRRNLV